MDADADEQARTFKRRMTTRSRAGCSTCKTRHIKCDESKPICINCTKGGRECGYNLVGRSTLAPLNSLTAETADFASTVSFGLEQRKDWHLKEDAGKTLPVPRMASSIENKAALFQPVAWNTALEQQSGGNLQIPQSLGSSLPLSTGNPFLPGSPEASAFELGMKQGLSIAGSQTSSIGQYSNSNYGDHSPEISFKQNWFSPQPTTGTMLSARGPPGSTNPPGEGYRGLMRRKFPNDPESAGFDDSSSLPPLRGDFGYAGSTPLAGAHTIAPVPSAFGQPLETYSQPGASIDTQWSASGTGSTGFSNPFEPPN